MWSQNKFYIDILNKSGDSIISDEFSPIKLVVTDEIGKVTVIKVLCKSLVPENIRETFECTIKIYNDEYSSLSEYKCGLLSSAVTKLGVEVTYLACPLECFSTKNTKYLGTNLISSINSINKNFSVDASLVTPISQPGYYAQLNMRDMDVAIELSKGLSFDSVVTYNQGIFKLVKLTGIPIDHLGSIEGEIDLYNVPYLFNHSNINEVDWRMNSHSFMGYHASNLFNREYYNNYFNNLKYYMSPSVSFIKEFDRATNLVVGDHVSATLDSTICNNFIIIKRSVTYINNEVNSKVTVGDYTNELRSIK